MKIMVTGVTGFLGGHLASALVDDGHTVVGTGRDPKRAELARRRGASVLLGDITEREFVCGAIAGAEAVIHAAALSAPWGSRQAFLSANVIGTENVMLACRRYRVRRVIHVSSPSVTFSGQDVFQQTEQALYPRRYLSFYSQSKRMAEDVVNHAIRTGLPATIVRPKAIFGPGDTTLLPRLIAAARAKRLVQIGDGSNLVDLTHVANVVRAILLVLKTDRAIGNTYTITNDEPSNLWSVIGLVASEILGRTNLRRVPYRVAFLAATACEARAALTGREPLLTRYSVAILGRNQTYDISALKRDTGYTRGISVKEGLQRTLGVLRAGE